jgi:hypothetical protein
VLTLALNFGAPGLAQRECPKSGGNHSHFVGSPARLQFACINHLAFIACDCVRVWIEQAIAWRQCAVQQSPVQCSAVQHWKNNTVRHIGSMLSNTTLYNGKIHHNKNTAWHNSTQCNRSWC